jgi:hypothetical protein
MKTIVMTTYRRPAYTRRVLEHLAQCDGIERYSLLVFCEPGYRDVIAVVEAAQFPAGTKKRIVENSQRLGCSGNTYHALATGFRSTDFVIVCEDDVLFARDALKFFEHCDRAYRDDKEVFTVGAFSRQICKPKQYYHLLRKSWFTPWGWATWSDRWVEIEAGLRGRLDDKKSWDVITNHEIRKGRFEVRPILARTQNIGADGGVHVPGPDWHRVHQFNEFWAGSVEIGEGVFGEPAEPSVARRLLASVFRRVVGRTPARQLWAWHTRRAHRRIIRRSRREI